MTRAHQPGSQPIDIPESIPNPAAPQPVRVPSPTPKQPVKVPTPQKVAEVDRNWQVHNGNELKNRFMTRIEQGAPQPWINPVVSISLLRF
jgi:hypothetical protein